MKLELPKKVVYMFGAALTIALLLYVVGVPGGIIALIGVGIWVVVLVAQGGHMEGNPYKRMRHSSVPDFAEVWQYEKRQRQELKDQASTEVTVFMFLLGLVFMLVGGLAYLFPWNIWSAL
ncbi:MAG: hypothetical protein ACE5IJ_06375 [Thermoplasmata archaeon]